MASWPYAIVYCVYSGDNLPFIVESISSLPGNEYLVVVLDGPVDNEIETYLVSKSHIVLKLSVNSGLAAALNFGIQWILEKTDAPYIVRMDSDDISCPQRIEMQLAYMVSNKELDLCGTDYEEFETDSSLRRVMRFPSSHDEIIRMLYSFSPICHASVVFRRSFFAKAGLYSTKREHLLVEDIELWIRAALNGVRFGNLNKVLYKVRINKSFYRRRSGVKAKNELFVYLQACKVLGFPLHFRLFPILRFILRHSPSWVVHPAYGIYRKMRRSAVAPQNQD